MSMSSAISLMHPHRSKAVAGDRVSHAAMRNMMASWNCDELCMSTESTESTESTGEFLLCPEFYENFCFEFSELLQRV